MEGFIQKVKEAVQNELGDSYEITETEVTKVNDSVHPTLVDISIFMATDIHTPV